MTTATKPVHVLTPVQVLKPASAMAKRERLSDGSEAFSVHVSDWYPDDRSVVFDATTQEHAVRLVDAINECSGWVID